MSGCGRRKYTFLVYPIVIVALIMLASNYIMTFGSVKQTLSKSSIHFQMHRDNVSSFSAEMRKVTSTTKPETSNPPTAMTSKHQKWALVDIKRHYNNSLSELVPHPKGLHRILWFNMPPWMESHDFMSLCEYDNCEVTRDRSLIRNVSAVLFCVIHTGMGYTPPLDPTERDPDQIWIFYGLESPFNYHFGEYASQHWRNTFNWSMTYRTDSDVQESYGVLRTLETPVKRDYNNIFHEKTKFAVWIVSHCSTHSKREGFVREMQKYVAVDIFGRCGKRFTSDVATLVKEYKFFLSFENSLCPDYVTEKFFRYFGLNVIQVVRGGVDYDNLLPNDTFINTAKFPDVKALTQYLSNIGSDQERYVAYLRRKNAYEAYTEKFTYKNSMCDLCRKLNHKQSHRKSYIDIHEYIQKTKVCVQPGEVNDIQPSNTRKGMR